MNKTDEKLYEEAEARVGFKKHLKVYVAINILIWLFWFITRARFGYVDGYWPIYSTLGWGFGLLSHYWGVYSDNSSAIEKEVAQLKRKRGLL